MPERSPAVKGNELNLYVSTWVELKNMFPREKKQDAERYIYRAAPLKKAPAQSCSVDKGTYMEKSFKGLKSGNTN